MRNVLINGRWPLILLEHRAARPEWPWWEAHRLALTHWLLTDHLVGDDFDPTVVYEVGAEEGDYPALYATWGADVVLIEPNPHVWPQIRDHWQANSDRPPAGWFVGFATDQNIQVGLDYDDTILRDGWPSCAHGPIMPEHGFRHIAEHAGTTRQQRLDTLKTTHNWPPPNLICVDVEGGEFHVLRGMTAILEGDRPHLIVSVHPEFLQDLYSESVDDLHHFVEGFGYTRRRICVDHEEHVWYRPPDLEDL